MKERNHGQMTKDQVSWIGLTLNTTVSFKVESIQELSIWKPSNKTLVTTLSDGLGLIWRVKDLQSDNLMVKKRAFRWIHSTVPAMLAYHCAKE